jgi:hypothetical protein
MRRLFKASRPASHKKSSASPSSATIGGIAFAPDGDPVVAECVGNGSMLTRFDLTGTRVAVDGSSLFPSTRYASDAGCGIVNHPNGSAYSNTFAGVVKINLETGGLLAGPFGGIGSALGIAVDPRTSDLVYVAQDTSIRAVNADLTSTRRWAESSGSTDGIFFDPAGDYLFLATGGGLVVLGRDGAVVNRVAASGLDGIAFHSEAPTFVVTNNTDGTMTRFDFPSNDYRAAPKVSRFASGGFRGDLSQVGPDTCLYLTQGGTRFAGGTTVAVQSVVRICPGFARPPSTEGPDQTSCTDAVDNDDDGLVDGLEPSCKAHRFVMVAFGDSYQSGEGVGLDAPAATYGSAYENGTNFSDSVGPQENTYTNSFVPPGGNSCHRAMANYAKINRTLIEPDAAVVLVDRTCSGATVSPIPDDIQPPIVGTLNDAGPSPGSQVDQALVRLTAAGIDASEVDLVTIGMGGNDAKFGDLVASCLIPSLARRLLEAYPNSPGELEGLVSKLLTCERVAGYVFKIDDAIKALKATEVWAQTIVRAAFPNARILQLTYPNVLPEKSKAPAWCGGMRKEDISYARKKSAAINDVIRKAAKQTRTEIVDVQASFGDNALCPRDPAWALTNGIDEGNFQKEVRRLLNLDGDGDKQLRTKLDVLVLSYQNYKDCLAAKVNPFRGCDEANAWANVLIAKDRFVDYLGIGASRFPGVPLASVILSNLVAPPGNDAAQVSVGFDRSRGLFHPKAAGFEVVACKVRLQYNTIIPQPCPIAVFLAELATVNSIPVTNTPVDTTAGSRIEVAFPGFAPGSAVTVEARSTPRSLGTFTANSSGVVRTTITVPSLTPGVHHLRASGLGAGNTGVQVEIPFRIPGQPIEGSSYGVYLTGFDPEPSAITEDYTDEQVTISYLGQDLLTTVPDETGGIFIEVPVVKGQASLGLSELKATSQRSGKVVRLQFSPTPLSLPGTP